MQILDTVLKRTLILQTEECNMRCTQKHSQSSEDHHKEKHPAYYRIMGNEYISHIYNMFQSLKP